VNHRPSNCNAAAGAKTPSPADYHAIAAQLRQAEAAQATPVDPAWIERVVAAAVAGVRASRPQPVARWRQLAAAAVGFLTLHAGAVAMSTAAVGAAVLVAVSVWPEGRNSLETMTPSTAIELLGRADQDDEARAAALVAVVTTIRARAQQLLAVRDDAQATAADRAAAGAQVMRLRAQVQQPSAAWRDARVAGAAAPVLTDVVGETAPVDIQAAGDAACALLAHVQAAPFATAGLQDMRATLLSRLDDLLAR
jgi:hypothetical protein